MYPPVDKMDDLAHNLFPETDPNVKQTLDSLSSEEIIITVPGAIIHLIDKQQSLQLATGDFVVVRLKQGENVIAVLARVSDEIQWPLAKDEAVVKLDESHYFFTLSVPAGGGDDGGDGGGVEVLSYGLTVASKGQDDLLKELDKVFESYSSFSVKEVERDLGELSGSVARESSPEEMGSERKKEMIERSAEAYWTTLAPNVEDYSSCFARMIAAGSGHVIRGILWCGDVTVDRLNWGEEFLRKRMAQGSGSEISPEAMRRVKRVKNMTKMCEKMAIGVLSGVVKVTGFFTSPIVNSKVGKKFFSLLPGEIILASLDGFNKVCDAVEVAGRSVMSTSSVVTTGVISHRYGDDAASITNVGFDAAGHAIGTAWAVFKIRKAFNLKSSFKPTTLVKKAAAVKVSEKKAIEK